MIPRRAITLECLVKISIKRLKDQERRDCDLYMKVCKRSKEETGAGTVIIKKEGVDEDMK